MRSEKDREWVLNREIVMIATQCDGFAHDGTCVGREKAESLSRNPSTVFEEGVGVETRKLEPCGGEWMDIDT